jgi:hypothetical protein
LQISSESLAGGYSWKSAALVSAIDCGRSSAEGKGVAEGEEILIWPFRNRQSDDILERAAEPLWKVEPPRYWPDPPALKENKMIELGHVVRDRITGFEGIVTGLVNYITGCNQALVQPKMHEHDFLESRWFDMDRLEIANQVRFELAISSAGPDKEAPRR